MSIFDYAKKFADGPQKVTLPEDVPFGLGEGEVKQAWDKSPAVGPARFQRKFDEVVVPAIKRAGQVLTNAPEEAVKLRGEMEAQQAFERIGQPTYPGSPNVYAGMPSPPVNVPTEQLPTDVLKMLEDKGLDNPARRKEASVESAAAQTQPRGFWENVAARTAGAAQTVAAIPEGAFNAGYELADKASKSDSLGEFLGVGSVVRPDAKGEYGLDSLWSAAKKAPGEIIDMGAGLLQIADAATTHNRADGAIRSRAQALGRAAPDLVEAIGGSAYETATNPIGTLENAPITGFLDATMAAGIPAAASRMALKGGAVARTGAQGLRARAMQFTDGAVQKADELAGIKQSLVAAEETAAQSQAARRAAQADASAANFGPGSAQVLRRDAAVVADDAAQKALTDLRASSADPLYSLPRNIQSLKTGAARRNKVGDVLESVGSGLEKTGAAITKVAQPSVALQAKVAELNKLREGVLGAAAPLFGGVAEKFGAVDDLGSMLDDLKRDRTLVNERAIRAMDATTTGEGTVGQAAGALRELRGANAALEGQGGIARNAAQSYAQEAFSLRKQADELRFGDDFLPSPTGTKTAAEALDQLDGQLRKTKRYQVLARIFETAPQQIVTLGSGAAVDLMGLGLRRLATRSKSPDPAALQRWAFMARNNRLPVEFKHIERELKGVARVQDLERTEALLQVPVEYRPLASQILLDEAVTIGDDLGPAATGMNRYIQWNPDTKMFEVNPRVAPRKTLEDWDVPPTQRSSVSPEIQPSLESTLEIANKYVKPIAERVSALTREAEALGIIGPQSGRLHLPGLKGKASPNEVLASVGKLAHDVSMGRLMSEVAGTPGLALSRQEYLGRKAVLSQTKGGAKALDQEFVLVPDVPRGAPKPFGELHGKYVQSDVITELRNNKKLAELMSDNALIKLINLWKQGKTAWSPATHGRNVLTSALLMAPAAGLSLLNPLNWPLYSRAMADLMGWHRYDAMVRANGGWMSKEARPLGPSLDDGYRMAFEDGVMEAGWKAELGQELFTAIGRPTNPVGMTKGLIQWGMRVPGQVGESVKRFRGKKPPVPSSNQIARQVERELASELRLLPENVAKARVEGEVMRREAAIKKASWQAPLKESAKDLGNIGRGVVEMPGALYGAEDNLFRLALYYKRLSEAATREGVKSIRGVSKEARFKAAEEARAAFVDYENVPGFVQVLRSPYVPEGATGAAPKWRSLYGAGFWAMSAPFIAYPSRAIPLMVRYLKEKAWQARSYLALHDLMTDISYAGTGRTEESDKKVLRASGVRGQPARSMGLGGFEEPGEVLGVDFGFLNPAGKMAPEEGDGGGGAVRGGLNFIKGAASIGAAPALIQTVIDIADDRDSFSKKQITKGQNTTDNLKSIAEFAWRGVLPPSAPGLSSIGRAVGIETEGKDMRGGSFWETAMGNPSPSGRVRSEGQQALAVGGINATATTPSEAVDRLMTNRGYDLVFGADSQAAAAKDVEGLLSRWDELSRLERRSIAARWAKDAVPALKALYGQLKELPGAEAKKAAVKVLRVYSRGTNERKLKAASTLLGKYRGQLGERLDVQKRTADDLGR